MAKYKIFQIHLTNNEVAHVNAHGHDSVDKQVARLDLMSPYRHDDVLPLVRDAFDKNYFKHVANITASGLEDVFTIGNGYGDKEDVELLDRMHSLSVGDVVEDDTGTRYFVNTSGFLAVA
tara:strand:- start:202 stop:561 length:360 start_codon:yes stop_codon:yes gene_type:complete